MQTWQENIRKANFYFPKYNISLYQSSVDTSGILNVIGKITLYVISRRWLTASLNFALPAPVSLIDSSKHPEQITTYLTLKLLPDIGVFNVNVLLTFLNVYSLDSKNDLQHSHRESWHFLTRTSSLLHSSFVS